jgi:alkylated DNA repair dioxygenase AlkB
MADLLRAQNPREPRKLLPEETETTEGQIVFTEKFLPAAFATEVGREMHEFSSVSTLPEIVVRGNKRHETSRRTAFYGDDGTSYRYTNVRKFAKPWGTGRFGRAVDRVRHKVEERTGRKFSYVLVNYYRDGDVALGYHADDEHDLDPRAPIVSVSLGASRDMLFKHKDGTHKLVKLSLPSGSMVEMHPPLQRKWKHSIPKRRGVSTWRINLTFRVLRVKNTSG